MPLLFGERDRHLKRIEEKLKITLNARGNRILIQGEHEQAAIADTVLKRLYERLERNMVVSMAEVEAAIRIADTIYSQHNDSNNSNVTTSKSPDHDIILTTRRKVISARSHGQIDYLKALQHSDLVFGIGPAGTGKTYLAVATAVAMLLNGRVKRIILSRPAVEAGEKLGYLPGDIRDKVDPYLRPIYDALHDMLPDDSLNRRFENGEIEIAPLAFMRGRTLSHAYIILDEAQNTTEAQMKMFLTRIGEGSKMAITGDVTQIDLPSGVYCGLKQATQILQGVEGIEFCFLNNKDVVRHPLVGRIVDAYDRQDQLSV